MFTAKNLINYSKKIGLNINENNTKYMVMSRSIVNKTNLKVGSYYFEQVENFKYMEFNIIEKNNIHKENKHR